MSEERRRRRKTEPIYITSFPLFLFFPLDIRPPSMPWYSFPFSHFSLFCVRGFVHLCKKYTVFGKEFPLPLCVSVSFLHFCGERMVVRQNQFARCFSRFFLFCYVCAECVSVAPQKSAEKIYFYCFCAGFRWSAAPKTQKPEPPPPMARGRETRNISFPQSRSRFTITEAKTAIWNGSRPTFLGESPSFLLPFRRRRYWWKVIVGFRPAGNYHKSMSAPSPTNCRESRWEWSSRTIFRRQPLIFN